ncbi:hypothetical protein LCGC14_1101470 [marine sediment metagenome]|uniref:Uncharacterized protein n=1 Tax=marine sediment metagenome TaxID=412755 RepID=A0A0F9PSL3_9ZZZZ
MTFNMNNGNLFKIITTGLMAIITIFLGFGINMLSGMGDDIIELKTNQGIIINSSKYIEKDIAENKENISRIETTRFTTEDSERFKSWIEATYQKK